MWTDVRCNHISISGWLCNKMLFRASTGVEGHVEIKCPKCSTIRVIDLINSYDTTRR